MKFRLACGFGLATGSVLPEESGRPVNVSRAEGVGRAMDRSPERSVVAQVPTPEGASSTLTAEEAFAELFASEHERLFRALYLITGSSQESEELMQDAFLKVWERWDR